MTQPVSTAAEAHDEPDEPADERPSGGSTALLVIDMLNDYEHEDGDALKESAREVVPVIRDLIDRAHAAGVEVIHVNDNHGSWDVDRATLVERLQSVPDARELIEPMLPADGAPFLFKARHSAFFASSLGYLLERRGIERVILTGQVTEQCILYTALDAYIRHFAVVVPSDAVACIDRELADAALTMMERNMRAEVVAAEAVDLTPRGAAVRPRGGADS